MNESMFTQLIDHLSGNLWLQGVLIAVGVCFLEDIARCATGLLVASGGIDWWVAFSGMMIGSLLGDLGLYLIGRYAMAFVVGRGWIKAGRIEKTKLYFSRHAIKAIIGARFFPGARTVAYAVAGGTRYGVLRFLSVLSGVTVLQTLIYLYGTELVGESFLACLKNPRSRWIAAGVVLAVIICGHFIMGRRGEAGGKRELDPPL